MAAITDEYIQEMLTKSKEYSIVLLKPGPGNNDQNIQTILWEHVRRNFALRADGLLPVVGPVTVESDVSGMGIFNASMEAVKKIMDEDPAVRAGIFIYDVYPWRSFPRDSLPA